MSNPIEVIVQVPPVGPPGPPMRVGIGAKGDTGREIEIQNNGAHVQWRYSGDVDWTDLVSLAAITGADGDAGEDGREIELRNNTTHVQWRYAGDVDWTHLIALADLLLPGAAEQNLNAQQVINLTPNVTVTGTVTAANLSGANTGDQDLSGLIPYTGATNDFDLGARGLSANTLTINGSLQQNVSSGAAVTFSSVGAGSGAFRINTNASGASGVGSIRFGGNIINTIESWGGTANGALYIYSEGTLRMLIGDSSGTNIYQSFYPDNTTRSLGLTTHRWGTLFNTTIDTSGNATIAGNLTVDANVLHVDSVNDRVGIGTTSPTTTCQIVNTDLTGGEKIVLRLTGGYGNIDFYGSHFNIANINLNSSQNLYIGRGGGGLAVGFFTGHNVSKFHVAGNTTIGSSYWNVAAPANGLLVEGNVGIGTTSPTAKLEVFYDSSNITRLENGYITVRRAGSANITTLDGAFSGNANNGAHLHNTASVSLGAGDSSRALLVNSSGNVGIGITEPTARLQINNQAGATKALVIKSAPSQTANLTEWQNSAGTVIAVMDASGSLGIGSSTISKVGAVAFTVTSPDPWVSFRLKSSSADWNFLTTSAGDFIFRNVATGQHDPFMILKNTPTHTITTNSSGFVGIGVLEGVQANRLTVNGNTSIGSAYTATAAPTNGLIVEGNIGIGTTTPTAKLDVNGTANVAGNTTIGGTLQTTGKLTANGQGALSALGANDVLTRRYVDELLMAIDKMRVLNFQNSNGWHTTGFSSGYDGLNFWFTGTNAAGGSITRRVGWQGRGAIGNSNVTSGWGITQFANTTYRLFIDISGTNGRWSNSTSSFGITVGDHTMWNIQGSGVSLLNETAAPASNLKLFGMTCILGEIRLWVKNGTDPSQSSDVLLTLDAAELYVGKFMLVCGEGVLTLYRNGVELGSIAGAPNTTGGSVGIAMGIETTSPTNVELIVNSSSLRWT